MRIVSRPRRLDTALVDEMWESGTGPRWCRGGDLACLPVSASRVNVDADDWCEARKLGVQGDDG